MKTKLNIFTLLAATAIAAMPLSAIADSGGCGTGDKSAATAAHAKYTEQAALPAIFPLAEEAGFSTLVAAVKAAGLETTLTEKGPFTVFAPTDEAFAKLPAGTVESLLANPEQLKKVLLYHVVSGSVVASDVVNLKSAATLNGAEVAINAEHGVMINDATVIKADVAASNGTIHVIDTVLIPADL